MRACGKIGPFFKYPDYSVIVKDDSYLQLNRTKTENLLIDYRRHESSGVKQWNVFNLTDVGNVVKKTVKPCAKNK